MRSWESNNKHINLAIDQLSRDAQLFIRWQYKGSANYRQRAQRPYLLKLLTIWLWRVMRDSQVGSSARLKIKAAFYLKLHELDTLYVDDLHVLPHLGAR